MEYVALIPFVGPALAIVIPFIVMIAVVIFIHELGHYLVGRWCGIHAETFSMGFGKELWHRIDKRGTRWRIAAVPVGGYVKFLGDADASSRSDFEAVENMSPEDAARSFPGAAIWKRMLTVAAGPVANFVLSVVVFASLALWDGVRVPGPVVGEVAAVPGIDFGLRPGDKILLLEGAPVESVSDVIKYASRMEAPGPVNVRIERGGEVLDLELPHPMPPMVGSVRPLSPASRAGLQRGDYIWSAGGEELHTFQDLQRVVMASEQQEIELVVLRGDRRLTIPIRPRREDVQDADGSFRKQVIIGITNSDPFKPASTTPDPATALWLGVMQVGEVLSNSINGIVHMIRGDIDASNIQGPLGIAQVSGEMAQTGLMDYVFLIGVISTAIGMLNLFPIPVLDGGHLVIFSYEALAGRQPPEKVLHIAMSIGLGMVLLLMVFATYNDIMRWLLVG